MSTIAARTLGCKVNQYDTQAMLELFMQDGYTYVSPDEEADVYLINTCTVTGTGDKKSLQLIRRLRREHPESILIVCGCLAQLRGEKLFMAGADLVLGTQRRSEVVTLCRQVQEKGGPLCAVAPFSARQAFEPLCVSSQNEHTRAVLKIQEGCSNHCSYCIIPTVRGPIRSRSLTEIEKEVLRLRDSGYCEIVLTGIHLSSYGKDLSPTSSLLDVISGIQRIDGILRIRLGSLEPVIATESFSRSLKENDKVCPQFHLALQSGSDSVLARMKRRYTTEQFERGVQNLRRVYPRAAFTTDVLTGFPGETEEEFMQTMDFVRRIGFSRIHVFPFSPRPDTPAASMPGQLDKAVKEERARKLILLGRSLTESYQHTWLGAETVLLPEEEIKGCWEGYTPEYIRVRLNSGASCRQGFPVRIRLTHVDNCVMRGEMI